MQWDKLKQNIGSHVRLVPPACRLDQYGLTLPERDEEWLIGRGQGETIVISMVGHTGHSLPLGKDQIHHYTSDPQHSVDGGITRGFLVLLVQIFIRGGDAWVRPTIRPGEALPPPPVKIEDRAVDFRYPVDSGLQARLETLGYRASWCLESRLARVTKIDGWEIVFEKSQDGSLARFRVKDRRDDQVLVKKCD